MSNLPTTLELKKILEVIEMARRKSLFQSSALEAKNKEAAKNQLLAIQLLLSKRLTK